MRRISLLLLLAISAIQTTLAPAAEPVRLRYRFVPDSKVYVRTQTSMDQTQNINGMEIVTAMQQTVTTEREIRQPDDKGQAQFRDRTLRLQMKMKAGPLAEYSFDSLSKDNDRQSILGLAATPTMEALSGAQVDVVLNDRGEVQSVKGLKEVLESALAGNPQAAQFAGAAASEDGAKMSYTEYFVPLPEKALSPGDTWEKPVVLALGQLGKAEGKTKFTYAGVKTSDGRQLHQIDFTPDISVDLDTKTDQYKLAGKLTTSAGSGTALFDLEKGELVSRTSELTMKGDLAIEIGGMSIPLRMQQTQKTTVTKLDGPPKTE